MQEQSSNKIIQSIKYILTCLLACIIIYYLYANYGRNLFHLNVPKSSSMYYLIHLDWKGYADAYIATLNTLIIPLLLIGIIIYLISRILNGPLKLLLLKIMPVILFIALFIAIFVPLLFVLNVTHFSFIATFLSFLALSKPAMVKMYQFSQKSVRKINDQEEDTKQ